MATKHQKTTMHHLTPDQDQKKTQLFKVIEKLRRIQNSRTISNVVVLTSSNFAADYVSYLLNLRGITADSTNLKSLDEIEIMAKSFSEGNIKVIVTNRMNIRVNLKSVQYLINYDMYVPNILFFENNQTRDIFHDV